VFPNLRSKIIFSFTLLMVIGAVVSTLLVGRNMARTLGVTADRSGSAFARTLAGQIAEPVAYGDHLTIRRLLTRATEANADVVYTFIVEPSGAVGDHSFPADAFPEDLLVVAQSVEPASLRTELGRVRDLPTPITEGVLGTLHVGVSMAWVDAATLDSVRNILFATALAMAAGILGILSLASLITRPLHGLREAAVRFGKGDLSAGAPVSGRDEIADLAAAFNNMADQIRERIAEGEALQQYVERVLDHMESPILVVSESGHVEYGNRVVVAAHGPLEGVKCCTVMSDERPCNDCPVPEVVSTGQVVHRNHRADSGRSYQLTYVPMLGRDGRRSVVERAFDVTEQLQLQERFQRAQHLAVAGEIAAGVVHSVNNPLDGVRRALDLAAAGSDDPERLQRMLALAMEGTDRISNITRTLLGFVHADDRGRALPVSPRTLVESAVNLVRLEAQGRHVTIEVDVAEDLPQTRTDPQGMEEVLVNLLLNAVDACDGGGRVVVRAAMSGDESLEISVSDSGPGVPSHLSEQIFQPFFTTKDASQGTGLGLAVARRVAEAHGGEVVLEPSSGAGAKFAVRIPMLIGSFVATEEVGDD
jgi:signal transduction histidine kinase